MEEELGDFDKVQENITKNLVATTRAVTSLTADDLAFHRSLDSSLDSAVERQNARLLSLADRLLGAATATAETVRPAPRLRDVESVESNWRNVVDVVDSLLERADTSLDEFTGAVKKLPLGEAPEVEKGPVAALKQREVERPQLLFDHVPTNRETGPFKPLLQSKPHALQPLQTKLIGSQYPHPYQAEIEQYTYPSWVCQEAEPIQFRPFESTSAIFVDTEEGVQNMLAELKQASEIAVDLEHHDQRSYTGIVCLMQISTRDQDWIVDTLKPWRRKLQCLNEVFADPSKLKVLHGAHMDIVWLQRDLGLYVVGMFDTYHASKTLGYPKGNFAFLLKKFTDVDAQKQYQMADWRVRPLPTELLDYARSDTHYLLYIYDHLRNELLSQSTSEEDKLHHVLVKSAETALQRYERPVYDVELGSGPSGWAKLLSRMPALLTREQFSVFRAVHKWRDDVAREQDDSTHYVMPPYQILNIAKAMPATREQLLGLFHRVPQTVRLRADELLQTIAKAKEDGKTGPDMVDVLSTIKPRSAPPQSYSGTTIKQQGSSPMISTTVLPLRNATSQFWGNTLNSPTSKRTVAKVANINLRVPLPPLTAEVITEEAAPTVAEPPPKVEQDDTKDVFILKQKGSKKRSCAGVGPAAADAQTERRHAKAERKMATRFARFAAPGEGKEEAEEPFDYEAAPSVLHPPREDKKKDKKKKKEVNPYAKALDTPRGLPRAHKEKTGKSMTFNK
ncbi:hypothetical protein K470DRAFT_269154 [Piedraia hortae CBS 480.64]|uniref:HRDC domain-containing protein n=1 Tax=Piedraia hortae CBS 480.64 TaxID=1314780 RepID=A0A6A7C4J8_9PEZI|nr:hypothetical protein K470DRAFT_269154 [Piedraia hortae CBS 480.64]